MNTLDVCNLSKTIKGRQILKDISFHADSSNMYAIIGTNGSGKSMLYKVLTGVSIADSGQVLFNKKELHAGDPIIGLMTDDLSFYPEYSGYRNLKMLASIRHIASDSMIRNAMDRVGLDPEDRKKFGKYSLGMKQRLCLAQAIMEQPDFLFFDEPSNGIDVEGMELLYQIVREERERGALIFISSHDDKVLEHFDCKIFRMQEGNIFKI